MSLTGILSFISNIFKPAADIVDELHVSDEERGKLRNELARIQEDILSKYVELEKMSITAQMEVQKAEASSSHWLAANWRPICALMIVGIIVAGSFGLVAVTPDIYHLAEIFLGVYGGGRSLEKLGGMINLGKLGK